MWSTPLFRINAAVETTPEIAMIDEIKKKNPLASFRFKRWVLYMV